MWLTFPPSILLVLTMQTPIKVVYFQGKLTITKTKAHGLEATRCLL